jgi:hypothetical protein
MTDRDHPQRYRCDGCGGGFLIGAFLVDGPGVAYFGTCTGCRQRWHAREVEAIHAAALRVARDRPRGPGRPAPARHHAAS